MTERVKKEGKDKVVPVLFNWATRH